MIVLEMEGYIVMIVYQNKEYFGIIVVMDVVCFEVKFMLIVLKKIGIKRMIMLMGDN